MIARLIESKEIAPLVRLFVFEAGDGPLVYAPGQFVSFTHTIGGKEITRAYSLASAQREDNRFEICLNLVENGHLSPHLFAMRPGDTLPMTGPLGQFVLRDPPRDSIFVATGTGIAPFRAFLQAHLHAGSPEFTLLFGVRHELNLLFRDEFSHFSALFSNFRFWPILSRPEAPWTGRKGHVQNHLEEAIGGRREVDFYLCGLKAMVDDVRGILKGMGFDRKQIRYERYD
jgi:CDP-4-dehydro-6-deoxyglucose reductase